MVAGSAWLSPKNPPIAAVSVLKVRNHDVSPNAKDCRNTYM